MGSWRAGCVATRTSGSEERAGEPDRLKGRYRAPARPLQGRPCGSPPPGGPPPPAAPPPPPPRPHNTARANTPKKTLPLAASTPSPALDAVAPAPRGGGELRGWKGNPPH